MPASVRRSVRAPGYSPREQITIAERVAAYRLEGRRVEVWRGDARDVPAGVVLFGRCRPLRAELESAAGRAFEPAMRQTVWGRRFDFLPFARSSNGPPWRLAVSLDYRPRNARLDARQTHPNLTHLDKLSDDVWWVLGAAIERARPLDVVMLLPLSHRHPEVVAVAEVLAVWSAVVHGIPFSYSKASPTFRFADLSDPSPFIDAIEDRDGVVSRALRAATPACLKDGAVEFWNQRRFEPD